MKIYFKNTIAFILLALLTITNVIAQPRKIEDIISKKASQKLYYQLALAAICQKDYENNKLKSTQANMQYRNKIQSLGKEIVINSEISDPTVDVLIRILKGSKVDDKYIVRHKRIEGEKYTYLTATIKLSNLETISELDNVLVIEPSFKTDLFLEQSTTDMKAKDVWSGFSDTPLPNKITGEGVYIGIIDTKPNKDHIAFLGTDNESRFKEIFSFEEFSYSDWSLKYHGTHVSSIAAGSGDELGKNKGVAYNSNILWYPSGKSSNFIVEAIDEMKKFAENKPLVINYSGGFNSGPRDGTLLIEKKLEEDLLGNVIFVNAAGNHSTRDPFQCDENNIPAPLHFRGNVTANINEFLEIQVQIRSVKNSCPVIDNNIFTIEIWHENEIIIEIEDNDLNTVPEVSPKVYPGEVKTWFFDEFPEVLYPTDFITIINSNSNFYPVVGLDPLLNNSKSNVVAIRFESTDSEFSDGIFQIRVYPKTNLDLGQIDAYICESNSNKGGFVHGDDFCTVASPGLANNVICVAAHDKNIINGGDIAAYSSVGPLRIDPSNYVSKPDISAPGTNIKSAFYENNNQFVERTGTSMSAPHVTGAIALLMQCFPDLNAIQVKEILQKSAGPISPSGHWQKNGSLTLEDKKYWGAGKLDILAAYKSMAGFSYVRPYAYDEEKFKAAFEANSNAGLPFGPVNYNWENNANYNYQNYTNGAIFSNNQETNAYWLGEGIWQKWIELNSVNSLIGLPQSSEFNDAQNNDCPTVKFQNGEIYWENNEAKIKFQPKFMMDVSDGYAPLTVQFTDLSRVNEGNITSWLWDFGDGSTSTEQNPVHIYNNTGTYFVKLTVRYNDKDFWITGLQFISVFQNIPSVNLSYLEYFLDSDPGFGKGISIPVPTSTIVNIQTNLSLKEINSGLHRLYFRAKDSDGKWSVIYSKPILVTAEEPNSPVKKVEYFFDAQNTGSGVNSLSFTPAQNITVSQKLGLENISPGLHRIYFKTQNEAGKWSTVHSKPVLVTTSEPDPIVTKVEYFFDNDPGINSGRSIMFTPENDVTVASNLPLDDLSSGTHSVYFRAKNSNGLWSHPQSSSFSIEKIALNILLQSGWNIFSTSIIPDSLDIRYISQSLINNNSLVKIQDEGGNSLEDWGIFGSWKNTIGSISVTEGYKIKVNRNDTLEVSGTPVKYPFAIPLKAGWNIAGYPQQTDFSGMNLVQQLADKGTLIKVQDEGGNSIEDWGIFGSWQNNIGNFMAGEGYKIKVSADDTLWVYESYPKSSAFVPEIVATSHFSPVFKGNGLDHMNINLVGLPVNILQAGDELAIFDGETCVGAVTLMPHHLRNQTASIVTSATDNQGISGFVEGNPFVLKLWNAKNHQEFKLEPEIVKGTSTFVRNETTVASLEKYATTGLEGLFSSEQPEINCYPNPFSDEITVEINLFDETHVYIEVLNQLGQQVKNLAAGEQLNRGVHRLIWDGTNAGKSRVAPGIYLFRMKINDTVYFRKVVYSK